MRDECTTEDILIFKKVALVLAEKGYFTKSELKRFIDNDVERTLGWLEREDD